MLETMKFAALIHPAVGAGILSSERILEMATIDGARALGLDDEVGSLEAGKKADVMVIGRRGKPHLSPGLKPVSDVVSCANGSDVDTVVVGDGCGDESNALDSRVASVDDRIVRRVVILLALIALALVVTVTITLRGRNAPTANVVSVQLPASGNAVATFLPDGRPVFVVTSRGGVTSVVDGVSTHRPYGVGYLIGWCPSSQTFDDPYHGSRWSSDGRYLLGPAPADLPTYTYRTLDGRVTIDPNPTAPTTRSTTRPRIAGPNCRPKDLVEPTFASGAWSSPANAVAGGDGWVDVLGELRVTRDGAELCDPSGSCPNAVPVPGVKGNVFRETGRWLARIEGHDITDLTALP